MVAKQMSVKKIPVGVKVISILFFIDAVLSLLPGFLFLWGGIFFFAISTSMPVLRILISDFVLFVSYYRVITIGFFVFDFFLGMGLWKGHNWSRITAIIFSAVCVLSWLFSPISDLFLGVVGIVIHGIIIYYLGFSKEAKAAFA